MLRIPTVGAAAVFLVVMCLGIWGLSGCSTGGGPDGRPGSLSGSDLEEAQALFSRITKEHSLHRYDEALATAEVLLALHPSFKRNDETLALAADSAARLDQPLRALDLTDILVESHPESDQVDAALVRGVELAGSVGDTLRGAGFLLTQYDRDPRGQTGFDGLPLAARFLEGLNQEDLNRLAAANTGSALFPYLEMLRVQNLVADGEQDAAELLVQDLEARAPDSPWTSAARALLSGGPPMAGLGPAAEVNPGQVGVICPLTGRYAVLGNAFYDAALLAVEVTNAELGTSFELKLEDSEGDPVAGALAAQRLCREEGSIAILGAMMSDPTAAVALVTDRWQVPLVSPTATNERIWELGDGVFQTNLTGHYETRLLATLATTVLLKQRFGILHPDTPEGLRYAEVFAHEVQGLGGEVVTRVAFPSHGTDFKDEILAVRQLRPEVIFVPASVDQMILVGPQLDFYRAGSLVLGLSNWNSDKLRERSGSLLERALFPNDLALFPADWTLEFRERWNGENYPREASSLALKTYQATRMLLDTLGQSEAADRGQLSEALRGRLANRDFQTAGPESFAGAVRMFQTEEVVPFPAGRFTESWLLTEGAVTDSLEVFSGVEPDGDIAD